ncbi:hypothetical protein N0V95_007739 [Ascochyta clinopodiicola]|nr:hypothetical protein N0V95_007739 [Ascochyta clinopodiicola]
MEEPSKLRIVCFGNELLGDELQHLVRQLHVHTKDRHHGTVARFIHEATQVLRDEVLQLPTALKSLVPPYESVLDLAGDIKLRAGPLGASIDGVLLCAFQLASAIGFYGDNNSADRLHDAGNTCFGGLGIGLLVAAAAASASSLENFVSAGREAVRLAFRLGIVVGEVSRNLHSPSPDDEGGAPDSWAYVVPEVSVENVQAELDAFHHAQTVSPPSQIFISAFGRNFVTISGPPGRLRHLSGHCDFFRDRRLVPLPVYGGLCHAKHIYGLQHMEAVSRTSNFDDLAAAPSGILFSTNTGRPFEADTARALFNNVIQEILTCIIKWDQVIQGIVDLGLSLGASKCQIMVARPSLPTRDLGMALESNLPKCKTETEDMSKWIDRPDRRPNLPRGSAQSKLAIVGMACRMPSGATDTEKFWKILEDGLDVHRVIPADRFDVDTHFDPQNQRMNASWTPYGCFIDEPGLFDAAFFNMSPREAQQTDPMQRLALVTAYEALERAGHVANRTPASHRSRTGTFYGQASDDYREVNSNQEISTYFITGGCRAFGPGRINYFFKFSGPSYSIDTACSSSLATLQMACTSLWSRDTDCAVVGGMNVLTNSDAFAGLSNGHFLSKTPNACKTWDSEADGYCRADGVGSVVIKRLEDAQADNDNILGVILGAGTNHSADAVSITHPLASAQADLTSQILRQAGVNPLDTQLALLCVEIALTRFYKTLGVEPDVVVGHSLGEYAALHVAGVLTAADAIFLVGHRAAMLESKCRIGSQKMLAVRAATDEISEVAKTAPYEIACINGPRDTVLSGSVEDIDALKAELVDAGFKCFDLDIAFAFHSSQTDPILDEFERMAKQGVIFQSPTMPIISPLLGGVVFDEKTINSEYLRRGTRETVNFLSAIQSALEIGTIDESMIWVEIGPHPVCTAFVQSIMGPDITTTPTLRRGENNWQTVASSLSTLYCAGINLDWNEFHRPHQETVRLLDLPTYAWNDKNHWLMYNGDWNLTKGNTYYDAEKAAQVNTGAALMGMNSGFITSTVQKITHETYSSTGGTVVMQSDLMQPDFLAAAWGHQMNDCGVVTSSIHADIAFTLGKYLLKKIRPGETPSDMNVANLHVAKGLVAQKNTTIPQIIQVSITIGNLDDRIADLTWSNISAIGVVDEPFATANILFGAADSWLSEWRPLLHLVQGRIDALEHLAATGAANRLSRSMAYTLFAANLVNYVDKYRGMQSVILHGLEAVAEVCLTDESSGTWTVPPYFIDSVAHLAGFIMNVSDVNDCRGNFHVTPGWDNLRFAEPLVAGGHYQSYVKMIPTTEDPTVYLGNVYVLRAGTIIGTCGGIKFKRYPRVLLDRFFSAPEVAGDGSHTDNLKKVAVPLAERTSAKPAPATSTSISTAVKQSVNAALVSVLKTPEHKEPPAKAQAVAVNADSVTSKAIALLAAEAQLDESDLSDDARFENLGVDSLMSLVIAEKLRKQLGVTVNGSLFLEYPTLGDLRAWLNEYYS